MTGFSQETRPIEIGDEIRCIDKRTKEHRPLVKRVTGVLKGPGGGVRTVLYVVNGEALARRCDGQVWRRWRQIADEEAAGTANKAARDSAAPPTPHPARRLKPRPVEEPMPPAFTETRDVLTKPVLRRCRSCPAVFETRVMTQHDCPGCTARARAAAQAQADRGHNGAA